MTLSGIHKPLAAAVPQGLALAELAHERACSVCSMGAIKKRPLLA